MRRRRSTCFQIGSRRSGPRGRGGRGRESFDGAVGQGIVAFVEVYECAVGGVVGAVCDVAEAGVGEFVAGGLGVLGVVRFVGDSVTRDTKGG